MTPQKAFFLVLISIIFFTLFSCTSGGSAPKQGDDNVIIGKWQVISNNNSGISDSTSRRVMEIRPDGSFESTRIINNQERFYNGGKYFFPDADVIVTVHTDPSG